MTTEIFALAKALLWPIVVVWIILKFQKEIRAILSELPQFLRRLLTMKAMGTEVTLADALDRELTRTEAQTKEIELPLPTRPTVEAIAEKTGE